MEIIHYRNARDLDVRFDSGYITTSTYFHFVHGTIKDLYEPAVCGVGYLGGRAYTIHNSRKAYNTWVHILWRCYGHVEKDKAYEGCVVAKEWHNFQNFAKWFRNNYYEVPNQQMQIDKDILSTSRVYSPSTCLILPGCLNAMVVRQPRKKKNIAIYGVIYDDTKIKKYATYLMLGDVRRKKSCEEEAYRLFIQNKEERLKQVAESIKQYLPKKVYDAIQSFRYEG